MSGVHGEDQHRRRSERIAHPTERSAMNLSQPEFTFTVAEREKYAEKVDRLLEVLQDGKWYTARELCRLLLVGDDRTIRKWADLSGGRVISTEQGYKLTRFATNDEIDHAENRLLSQARRMTERAVEIRKARNGAGRAA